MRLLDGQHVGKWVFGIMLGASVLALPMSYAQAETDDLMDTTKHPVSVTMAMQADSFFGFNPAIYGTYGLTKDVALAFNITYWNNISGLGVHNANPWLETDMGLNFTFLEKRLSVTPMVGFVHGMLLSSRGGFFPNGDGSTNERTTVFEGVVPSLTMNYMDDRFEGEFYMGYYKHIREEGGKAGAAGAANCSAVGSTDPNCLNNTARGAGGRGSWDFLHYWVNGGYRFNSMFSAGVHYEHLLSTSASATGPTVGRSLAGYQQDYYRWIGPYVELKLAGGMAIRFTAGHDTVSTEDFYKLKFTKTF